MNYPGFFGTTTLDFTTVNMLLNGIVSTHNAKFMTIDNKGFYLNHLMASSECIRLKLSDLPKSVVQQ